MPQITGLGHVGLYCNDLERMRDFYASVLGLTISDEDLDRGICFLSAAPEAEHHELALVRAKEPAQKTHNVQQVSFKVKSLDDVRSFHQRLQKAGMRIDRTITTGSPAASTSSIPRTTASSCTTRRPTRYGNRSASPSTSGVLTTSCSP